MKIFYYFSCVTRNAPIPCHLYQNKFPFYNITNCKISFSNISNFAVSQSLLHYYYYYYYYCCCCCYLDKPSNHINNGDLDKEGTHDSVPNVCKSSCEMPCISTKF